MPPKTKKIIQNNFFYNVENGYGLLFIGPAILIAVKICIKN